MGKLRAHADAVVLDAELILSAAADLAGKLAHPQRHRAARGGELDGVGQKVHQNLIQPGLVAIDVLIGNIYRVHIQFQLLCVKLPADDGLYVVQHVGQVDLGLVQLDLSAFDAAHIQNIIDERKQVAAGGKYLGKVFLHAVPVVQMADRQRGKADDGIHRGADVVGHIGKEGALGAVGVFGGGHGIRERLVRLPVGGAVRQNQNVLGLALDLAAHGNHMEPAMLPGFLMDKLRVPFALVAAGKPFQIIFGAAGEIRRVQQGQRADIFAHALHRQAQQPFYVRADIIRPVLLGIQQQENVVHVLGQLLEQHIPVQNRGVLAAQLGAAPVHDHQKDHCRNRQFNEGYDLHRAPPKLVHGGIDGIPRDKAHQDPVLDAGAFVDHIVSCAVQRHLAVSGDALRKVVRKLLYLRLGKVGILLQYRYKIVNGFRVF